MRALGKCSRRESARTGRSAADWYSECDCRVMERDRDGRTVSLLQMVDDSNVENPCVSSRLDIFGAWEECSKSESGLAPNSTAISKFILDAGKSLHINLLPRPKT